MTSSIVTYVFRVLLQMKLFKLNEVWNLLEKVDPSLLKQMNQQVKHIAHYDYKNNSKQAPPLAQHKGMAHWFCRVWVGTSTNANCTGDTMMCTYGQVSSFNCAQGIFQMSDQKNLSHKLCTKMPLLWWGDKVQWFEVPSNITFYEMISQVLSKCPLNLHAFLTIVILYN